MKNQIQIFILSMRKSLRLPRLRRRLDELNLTYKVFYGLEEKNNHEKKIIYSQYNRKKVLQYLGRDMSFNEIGGMYTITRIYKYAAKKNLKNIICFDDDFYPSSIFKEWIKKKVYFEGDKIIHFNTMGTGFLKKKPFKIINNKIKIHRAVSHLYNPGASQITLGYIKKFLKITKGKTIGQGDYPFNLLKNKIQLYQTIPYMGYPDHRGQSFMSKDRAKLEKTYFKNLKKFLYQNFEMKNVTSFLNFLRIPYYVLCIPFLLRKYKNFSFYKERYLDKHFYKIVNFFLNYYIDIDKIYHSKKTYPKDLKKFAKHQVFDDIN